MLTCGACSAADGLKAALKEPPRSPPDPGFCSDSDARCTTWVAAGECSKNPAYMTGNQFALGACRLSCKACEPCTSTSAPCYAANRIRAGFLNLFDEIKSLTTRAR